MAKELIVYFSRKGNNYVITGGPCQCMYGHSLKNMILQGEL